MKVLATLLLAAAFAAPTGASESTEHRCTAQAFRAFSAAVWDYSLWERGQPPARTIRAQRNRLACAPAAHRQAMKRTWRRDRAAYFERRRLVRWRMAYTPYYGCTVLGGCGWWALPAYIVDCESGGDFTPDSGLSFGGAYGLLVSTWQAYGGSRFASQANYATPAQQAIVATAVWNDVGPSGWACA